MSKPWLLIDSNFLCHRVFYSFKKILSSEDANGTETIYGFLWQVQWLFDRFNTDKIAFFWDYGKNKRCELFADYKARRRADKLTRKISMSDEEKAEYKGFKRQMRTLRVKHLKALGFMNIFWQMGYEGDDLIASACKNLPKGTSAIIVTEDQDMYQCLRPNISMYRPNTKNIMTVKQFRAKYGISPRAWSKVKALAGCDTDSVPGIPQVGEKTAIKYLKGNVNPKSVIGESLATTYAKETVDRNMPLVKLPFAGTKDIHIVESAMDGNTTTWNKGVMALKMPSLRRDSG